MIVFYSGDGCPRFSHPEVCWGAAANVMLTYYHSHGARRPEQRFRRLRKLRRRARGGVR